MELLWRQWNGSFVRLKSAAKMFCWVRTNPLEYFQWTSDACCRPITGPEGRAETLEPISNSFEEDDEAGELYEAEKILRIKHPA